MQLSVPTEVYTGPPVSKPEMKLHADDHKNIKAARLRVHLTVDPYYLPLPVSVRERRLFPSNAEHRLQDDGNFEFHVYRSQSYPHPLIGIQGDVWINITRHRGGVWFRGSSGSWEPWIHGCEHDGAHLGVEGHGTAHPWIRGYCLQFTGLDIWWYQHEALPVHQARWDRVWGNRLPYGTLPHLHPALVRHNAIRRSLSRHRVFPGGRLGRGGRKKGGPKQVITADEAESESEQVPMEEAADDPPQVTQVLADTTNLTPSTTTMELMDVTPKPLKHSHEAPVSAAAPEPASDGSTNGDEHGAIRSIGEGISQIPCKRPLPPSAALEESGRAAKRRKITTEAQDTVDSSLTVSTTLVPSAPEAQAPAWAMSSGSGIHTFLGSLSFPLTHHAAIFVALGITSRVHLEALAHTRDEAKEQFLRELEAREISSIELMVLCEALKAIQNSTPAPHLPAPHPAATPSISAFLPQMRPSMSRHLAAFEHFGVGIEHLPVLAGMQLGTYELFEGHLADCGVTWVERLLFKAAISVGR
ncbi:hypothetical protein C8Q78DRAFT_1076767 [Trametes maxima]|nr:hypothetical protein C8Q78DRAFT_1076767 [Trametes maxima]